DLGPAERVAVEGGTFELSPGLPVGQAKRSHADVLGGPVALGHQRVSLTRRVLLERRERLAQDSARKRLQAITLMEKRRAPGDVNGNLIDRSHTLDQILGDGDEHAGESGR